MVRCNIISIIMKLIRIQTHSSVTINHCVPVVQRKNTPVLAKASTSETATAPAAAQRTACRPQ
tara:strand:- start:24940 stop:25128 length:189 start_codon:yes stop_codon:yes gene_type:complete